MSLWSQYLPEFRNADPPPAIADSAGLEGLPLLRWQERQLESSRWALEAEKKRLLPSFLFGLNSQSIIGYQTVDQTERYFDGWKRFNYLQAGVALPLFSRAQRARIAAAEIQVLQQQSELEAARLFARTGQAAARQALRKHAESLAFYEAQLLPEAQTLLATADRQLAAGEIDYLQWVLLIQQVFELKHEWLEEQRRYNAAALDLQFFTND